MEKKYKYKFKQWIINQVHAMHWGQFLVGKIQFIFTLLIFVEVYDFNLLTKIIIVTIGIIGTLFIGKFWIKYFKEDFQYKFFKGSIK